MNNRQQQILYYLATSEDPLTAGKIAQKLGLSERTIKTEMESLRLEAEKIGVALVAVRNRGYSIKVTDHARFDPYIEQLYMKLTWISNLTANDNEKFVYIARKVVSTTDYVKIEDLADEMYMSKSSIREAIRKTIKFLGSYNLPTDSRPGLGMRVAGKEQDIRIAMTELFAIHYHKIHLDNAGTEYRKWVACDEQERQDIRHSFLRTLYQSGIPIQDINTQRMSVYLIIARNRYRVGYTVSLRDELIAEIRLYEEYRAASGIFAALAKNFDGYDMPEPEVAFFAMWLLGNRDTSHIIADRDRFPTFCDDADRYAGALTDHIKAACRIDLNCFDWAHEELKSLLVPVLAAERFDLSWPKTYLSSGQSESPFTLEIARIMTAYLKDSLGFCCAPSTAIHLFSVFIYKILFFTEYDIRKLKLLIVNSDGIGFGEFTARKLNRYFGWLIESCDCVELYQIRHMNRSDYDAVFIDSQDFSYNYELPHGNIHTVLQERDLNRAFNSILVQAYQVQELLPDASVVKVYRDFDYVSEEEFFQLISLKQCTDAEKQKRLKQLLLRGEELSTYRCGADSAILFGNIALTGTEAFEVYFLKRPGYWAGSEINYIVYVCVDIQLNTKRSKAIEMVLYQLCMNPELYRMLIDDISTAFMKLVQKSLKI